MSAAERFRRHTLAAAMVARLRGMPWPIPADMADTRQVEDAAADALEALLAAPEPGDAPSAEERARWAEMANAPEPWTRYRVAPILLAALTAAEERAAQAEREREDMRAERDAARFSLRQFEAAFATEQVRADDAERAAEALAAQIVETKQTLFERTGEEP